VLCKKEEKHVGKFLAPTGAKYDSSGKREARRPWSIDNKTG
jgi:hypothetical protein